MAEDMGVTGNAVLLLGYIAGAISRGSDEGYVVVDADPAAGVEIVSNRRTGNTFRISVVQLGGAE